MAKPKGARAMNREAEEIARTWANRLGFDLVRHFGAYRLVSRNPQRVISEARGSAQSSSSWTGGLEQEMRRLQDRAETFGLNVSDVERLPVPRVW
jgi:hypothetical protein